MTSNRAVLLALLALGACDPSGPVLDGRQQRIANVLSEDNYMWAQREPALVALKLRKMQRGPYEWMRGTAALYWRDLFEPGGDRPTTTFGDEASSRVLLVGDPHPENIGTFRSADGTMFLDWNDFDSTGYGPFTGDLRRLGAGLALVSASDATLSDQLIRNALAAYAETIIAMASGATIAPIERGRSALFDDEIDKAEERGLVLYATDEVAPVMNGARAIAFGDLEDVAPDGVIEDRLVEVDAATSLVLDRAVAQWGHPEAGAIKLRARRIGSGVSSYAALRYNVVLEGATSAPDDDRLLEIKETREGVVVENLPRWQTAEWAHPAARSVDTQQRLQAMRGDALLGAALVGGLSVKIRDRESFQRGINASDLSDLVADDPTELADIAAVYGELLARAHGQGRTENGARGATVIAPLLANRVDAFVDELAALSLADARVVIADHARMRDLDLAPLVIPEVAP